MKYFIVLPCAGQGRRFGAKKQFIKLFNKEIFLYTLDEIRKIGILDKVILTFPKENIIRAKQILENYYKNNNFLEKIDLILGGKERQESVYLALKYIYEKYKPSKRDIVSIHDCVRPLVKKEYFVKSYELLFRKNIDGVILGAKPKDTVKEIKGNFVKKTLNRENLILTQTPQTFFFKDIYEAHLEAQKENVFVTDDSSLLERKGKKIFILKGDYKNIKITTLEDLYIMRVFLNASSN